MTTSKDSSPMHGGPGSREPLRLRMVERTGNSLLDGGWWPQSRDLAVELADLVDHFPVEHGRVVRALYSPPDWDGPARRVAVGGGYVKAGSFPGDDTHLIRLRTYDHRALRVLVIPPGYSRSQGEEALLAASTPGNTHAAAELLATVTDSADVDPVDHWE